MKLLVTGLNHKTAPVEVRERVAFPVDTLPAALAEVRGLAGVSEALIVSTCNRVEIAVAADDETATALPTYLAGRFSLDETWLSPYLYHHAGEAAIRHLFRVAASLDSMVPGEPQILGQMKAAYSAAREAGTLDGALDCVLARAFSVAKRVRSETEIGKSAVSVSYAAVELARQIFGQLNGRKVLLIGAGKMSELAARHLRRAGCGDILVANRTHERAAELAAQVAGEVIDYTLYTARLAEVDIVITSSGAPEYLLRPPEMRRVLHARRNRPMFLIDIAVPRNIDPAVNDLEHAFLYDIDDLGRAVAANLAARHQEATAGEQIIEEEVHRLVERLRAREVAPTIVSLHEHLEELARQELERHRGLNATLDPKQSEALHAYTRGLINKIAHGAITELRHAASSADGNARVSLIRRIFRLDE